MLFLPILRKTFFCTRDKQNVYIVYESAAKNFDIILIQFLEYGCVWIWTYIYSINHEENETSKHL